MTAAAGTPPTPDAATTPPQLAADDPRRNASALIADEEALRAAHLDLAARVGAFTRALLGNMATDANVAWLAPSLNRAMALAAEETWTRDAGCQCPLAPDRESRRASATCLLHADGGWSN